jgi:hypothetical protein
MFVKAWNQCGYNGNGWAQFEVPYGSCYGGFFMIMYPNPAHDFVELTFIPEEEIANKNGKIFIESSRKDKDDLGEYEIQLWSETQTMMNSIKSNKKKLKIDTKSLIPGTYYVHFMKDETIYKQQLVIE